MLIGIPKEIKDNEFRVSISPYGVKEISIHGHQVLVEKGAGSALGFEDRDYIEAGAHIVNSAAEVYLKSELIVKVKEPQLSECAMIREGQIIFSYLHLAACPEITKELLESNCIAIAYETVTSENGTLPLLAPMSEVAGRVAVQQGAYCLEKICGGRGVLLGGVPGVKPGKVTIIGGGVVGTNAAIIASGMGADVVILDKSIERIRELEIRFDKSVRYEYATTYSIEENVKDSDLVIGAVLVPGASAPKLITADMVKQMHKGSVIVDVAIDQGGCVETSRPTTHNDPIYDIDGVVHYCVTNMPSVVARTSSKALEIAILDYVIKLANKGYRQSFKDDIHFRNGLNIYRGRITHEAVSIGVNQPYVPPSTFLN